MPEGSFGLQVQQLPRVIDRALVLGQVMAMRTRDGWFDPADIARMFEAIRIPSPADVSNNLAAAAREGLTVRRVERPRWSLTPTGRAHVLDLVGEIDLTRLAPELSDTPHAVFGSEEHGLIPPAFAPPRWAAGLSRMLSRFPFEKNVFCMTRIPKSEKADDPLHVVIAQSRAALARHGLTLHLATDRVFNEELLGNVAAYIWACKFGLGFLEDLVGEGLNYNVIAEVGAMEVAGRRCGLLKDPSIAKMPTDLVGQIYKSVDLRDERGVIAEVHRWVAADLGLGRCGDCA